LEVLGPKTYKKRNYLVALYYDFSKPYNWKWFSICPFSKMAIWLSTTLHVFNTTLKDLAFQILKIENKTALELDYHTISNAVLFSILKI